MRTKTANGTAKAKSAGTGKARRKAAAQHGDGAAGAALARAEDHLDGALADLKARTADVVPEPATAVAALRNGANAVAERLGGRSMGDLAAGLARDTRALARRHPGAFAAGAAIAGFALMRALRATFRRRDGAGGDHA